MITTPPLPEGYNTWTSFYFHYKENPHYGATIIRYYPKIEYGKTTHIQTVEITIRDLKGLVFDEISEWLPDKEKWGKLSDLVLSHFMVSEDVEEVVNGYFKLIR